MIRNALRLSFALALSAFASACTVDGAFDVEKTIQVSSATTAVDSSSVVNLFEQSSQLAEHRDKIDGMQIDSIEGTIISIEEGNQSTHLTGTFKVAGIDAGAVNNIAVALDQKAPGTPSKELDAVLMNAIRTDGLLPVTIQGTSTGAPVRFSVKVQLRGTANIKPF